MGDLRLLANFVALFQERSFRQAAERLGVAQSSVTKRLQILEAELGLSLFNRTTRSVEPTDSARQLLSHAERALQTAAVFSDEARLLSSGEIGAIRVGAIALAAETLLVSALLRLSQTHPNVEVDVVVGGADIYHDLVTGECDVVVGDKANFESSPHAAALRVDRVCSERLIFVHRTKHPGASARSLDALLDYPLAVPSRYFNENHLFAQFAQRFGSTIAPRYRLNSLSACLSLVARSDVVSLAPESLLSGAGQTSRLGLVAFRHDNAGIDIELVQATVARHSMTPAVRAFCEALEG